MRIRRFLTGTCGAIIILMAAAGLATYRAVGTFDVWIPADLKGDTPGHLIKVDRIGKYPAIAVKRLIGLVELPNLPEVTNGITMYRVQYQTTNHDGSVTMASGMLAIPSAKNPEKVVTFFHGTNTERFSTPSQLGMNEGFFGALIMAGTGSIYLAPDYIGLGESRVRHPYMHLDSTSNAILDFFKASHDFVEHHGIPWPSDMYLMGFSQGGQATLVVQRDLETLDDPRFHVIASAPIAAPAYLFDISFPQALTGETDSHEVYLCYISNSYSHIYGQPIDSLLTSPFDEQVPLLFDGDHTSAEVSAAMPDHPRDLFTQEFLDTYDSGGEHWFLDALKENSIAPWSPKAPIHIFYGDNDVDVSPEEAKRLEKELGAKGADIRITSVGPYDHSESTIYAIPQALKWFETIR